MVLPTGSPASSAMRSAAARAARRRGERRRIWLPATHGSFSRAGATAVVFPAPGGAIRTALGLARSSVSKSGRTALIGSGINQ